MPSPNDDLAKFNENLANTIGRGEGTEKRLMDTNPVHPDDGLLQENEIILDNIDEKNSNLPNLGIVDSNTGKTYTNVKPLFLYPPPLGYISEEVLDRVLDLTIKGDEVNRKILFIGSLLNYTAEDQLNFGLSGDSAIGKSHNTLEIAALHPVESLIELSYTSPRAFFHDKGILIDDETGEEMESKSEFVEKALYAYDMEHPRASAEDRKIVMRDAANKYYDHPKHLRVDLKQKLLVFVDMPSPELLTYLRSLLSHDKPSIWVKITDKGKGGENKTKNVEIIGFPTLFFNSTNFALDAQEQTRLFLLSPDGNQGKLKKTLPFIAEKVADRPKYRAELEANEERNNVKALIGEIKELGIQQVIISPEDVKHIVDRFMEEHLLLVPRLQRDLPRLLALVKGYALFNASKRQMDDNNNLYATSEDVEKGYELYKSVSDSNELGLPPHIYEFYKKVMLPTLKTGVGYTRRELALEYYSAFKTHIGDTQMGRMVQLLNEVGLIVEETDPNDRRIKRVYNAANKPEAVGGIETFKSIPSDIECLRRIPELINGMKSTLDSSAAREDVIDKMMVEFSIKERPKAGKLIDTALRDGSIYAPRPGALKAT